MKPPTRSRLLGRKLRRDVARQRAPFLAVAVTMMLGVTLFGAAYDAYRNLLGSYDEVFDELRVADIWVTGGDTAAIARAAGDIDGVREVATRVQVDVPVRVGGRKLAGRVVGLAGDPVLNDVYVLGGHRPGEDGRDGGVLAEDHLAAEFGLEAGDEIELLVDDAWQAVEVTGRASSGEYLWLAKNRQEVVSLPDEFGVVFAPDHLASALVGAEPNQVLIRVAGRSTEAVRDELEAVAAERGASDVYTLAEQPSNEALAQDIQGFSQMALLFPLLFLTAAGMASYTLLSRRIHAERSIVGMLRAHGVSRRRVLRHYLGYGVLAGLSGAVPGVLLGLWLARVLTSFYVGFLSLPITAVSFHPETPLLGVAFGLVAGAAAALAPARRAAAVPPADAMRGIVPTGRGQRTLLERVLPGSARLPASARLVVRSIARNRRRTAMTTAGVVLSLLLILVSWSMLDTIHGNLDDQFGERDRSDALVVFAGLAADEDLDAVAAVDGVEVLEPLTVVPLSIRGPEGSYATILEARPQAGALHTLDVVSGRPPAPGAAEIVVGEALRDILGVEVGDTVAATATGGGRGAEAITEVRVVGFVHEAIGTFAYTTQTGLAAALGQDDPPVNAALVKYATGTDEDAAGRRIEALEGVAEFRSTDSLRRLIDDATALLVGFVTIMLIVGGIMAATMIFTTASVSIAERRNEVATLRASGVTLGRIARLVTAENLIVTALGVVPGLVVGVLGGRMMMRTYATDQFSFTFIIEPLTLVGSATAVFVVALLSQVPGLRALRRLDLAGTVREQSA